MNTSTSAASSNAKMDSIRRLVIVSHVVHYRHHGQLWAYGPYAREIDLWAEMFPQIVIASPCRTELPPGDCIPFTRSNVSLVRQRLTGGRTLWAKVRQFLVLPLLVWDLCRTMRKADAIHVRCPGNLGLLGAILAPLFSRRLVAKYAGQWNSFPNEAWSWRVQKAILRSRWWRGPVTVYGRWPNQPSQIVPFFTSVLTSVQLARARAVASEKAFGNPLRVVFVGRLSAGRNVDTLISALAELKSKKIQLHCTIVGDGPERPVLEEQVAKLNLLKEVEFAGSVEFERVLTYYEQADILVLAGNSEAWGKALVEGMAFGLICIGADRGVVPELLGQGRGLLVSPGDVRSLAKTLGQIAMAPAEYQSMREQAAAWAQKFSLEDLKEALHTLLAEQWGNVV